MLYRNEEKKRAKQLVMTAHCSVKVLSVPRWFRAKFPLVMRIIMIMLMIMIMTMTMTMIMTIIIIIIRRRRRRRRIYNFRLVRSLLDPSQCYYTETYSIFVGDSLLTLFSREKTKLASARNKCPHAPHSEREKRLISSPSLSFCEPTVFSAVDTPIFLGCNVLASDSWALVTCTKRFAKKVDLYLCPYICFQQVERFWVGSFLWRKLNPEIKLLHLPYQLFRIVLTVLCCNHLRFLTLEEPACKAMITIMLMVITTINYTSNVWYKEKLNWKFICSYYYGYMTGSIMF